MQRVIYISSRYSWVSPPKKHIKSTEIRSILCIFVEEIFSSFGAFNRKNATIMT